MGELRKKKRDKESASKEQKEEEREKNKNERFGVTYAMLCGCCCNNHGIEREIEISVSFMITEYNAWRFS